MRESRSYGSVGARGGNEPLYPEMMKYARAQSVCTSTIRGNMKTLNLELPVKTDTSSFLARCSIFGVQFGNEELNIEQGTPSIE